MKTDTEKQIKAIIVDDERHVRIRISDLLKPYSTIQVVGEAENGIQAVEMIGQCRPNLAFLDIQMPLLDGFDVLHALDPHLIPVVVFVTAFDEHAIKAFDVNAVDYVLKPIDETRFAMSVARSIKRINELRIVREQDSGGSNSATHSLHRPCRRLLVKNREAQIVLRTSQIRWIEAADKYVRIHTGEDTFTSRNTMRELQAKLDESEFMRVHRSIIVNLASINKIEPHFHGEFRLILEDETVLPLGRSFKQAFLERFQSGI